MSASFDLNDLEHFTVGTIGAPGQRVFYLQAGVTGTLVSLKLEKQQVAALAEYLAGALREISDDPDAIIPEADIGLIDPVEAEWTVGDIGIGYDSDADRMLVMATEMPSQDDPSSFSEYTKQPLSWPRSTTCSITVAPISVPCTGSGLWISIDSSACSALAQSKPYSGLRIQNPA